MLVSSPMWEPCNGWWGRPEGKKESEGEKTRRKKKRERARGGEVQGVGEGRGDAIRGRVPRSQG